MSALIRRLRIKLRIILETIINRFSSKDVVYIIEGVDWVIKREGENIVKNLVGLKAKTALVYKGLKNKIIHYGSINTFLRNGTVDSPNGSNKIVVTWYHIVPGSESVMNVKMAIPYVDIWHTSCEITKRGLIELDVPENKIEIIPIGVDLKVFKPFGENEKQELKYRLNIPEGKIIIGSFQKDGNGWGEGLTPKMVKGPDIFCNVIEKLTEKFNIHVLLTGPARGYVRKRLEQASISYSHQFVKNIYDMPKLYNVLDLYIVTSRIEGGPKSITESMACGVPVISTKVGMAPEVIEHGRNGFLTKPEDTEEIVSKSCLILRDQQMREGLIKQGLSTVRKYDYAILGNEYVNKIYRKLL